MSHKMDKDLNMKKKWSKAHNNFKNRDLKIIRLHPLPPSRYPL